MKKFTVHLSYHGCFTAEVEAPDEESALEKARFEAASLAPADFVDAIEPIEIGHDIEEISMPKAPKTTYWQPEWYSDDGTNLEYGGLPNGLFSFQVFLSREACVRWLEDHNYDPGDFVFHEYEKGDIEEPTILDY